MSKNLIQDSHKTSKHISVDMYSKFLANLKIGAWSYHVTSQKFTLDTLLMQLLGMDDGVTYPNNFDAILDIVHPRDKHSFDFIEAVERDEPVNETSFECRLLHADGEWMWVEIYYKIIRDTSGKSTRIEGVASNIDDKKKNEFLFNKYEDLLDRTNEAASIGTWEVDLVANTIVWSKMTKEIHEVPQDYEPSLDTGINFYKKGVHRDRITKMFNDCVVEGKGFDDEFIIKTHKGIERWVRSIGVPVLEKGSCVKVYGLFQDIDEKTRALQYLATTEERFRKTFDFANSGMAMVDTNGQWLRVNQSLCDMLGYTKEEFLKLSFPDFTHPDNIEKDRQLLIDALKGNIDAFETEEKRYIHKDGSTVWAILSISLIRDDKQQPLHFVAQIIDITQRITAEEEVRKLLELTNSQNDRLLNFAHIVSHNLRSHSGNLDMLLTLLEEDFPRINESEMFGLLRDSIKQLEETVFHLNEVAALNTQAKLKPTPQNLNEYIQRAIQGINSIILENDATIINEVSDTVMVAAIPAYLDSIILNFITNAIKYKSPDRAPVIEISAKKKGNYIEMAVKDNGLGINLAMHREKLFGMYKTFHKHEDSRGLGLFITKNQIEAMNGKVSVESEVGKGTTFFVSFLNENN